MNEKYDKIGLSYNSTRRADPFLVERLFHHLAPKTDQKFLDVGCGTGNYTIALHLKGLNFVGVDPSIEMLKMAQSKSDKIDWVSGKVEEIPFRKQTFDGAIATLTTHHWSNLRIGFSELSRVLKPKSNLVIFTSTPKQMRGYWLNHYFPKMLEDSMQQMPKSETVEDGLDQSGFEIMATEKYFVKDDLKDCFLYIGKHQPELYLNQKIRQGISSFSLLAHHSEIKKGLDKLQKDIASGKINDIIDQYKNDHGDYLFVVAKSSIK